MLGGTQAAAGVVTTDLEKARTFYGETLGLRFKEGDEIHATFDAGGTPVFVYEREDRPTADHTLLTWSVDDLEKTMKGLKERGISFEHYGSGPVKTDDRGISASEELGMKAAWFKDPDGNVLGLIEETG